MNRLLTQFYNTPWAVLPETLAQMQMILHRWASGVKLTNEQIMAAVGDAPEAADKRRQESSGKSGGGIAVVPLHGVMTHRAKDAVRASSTLASTEILTRQIRQLANDASIDAIVLDVDSPGGSVFGLSELATEIMEARKNKKVVAVCNDLMASAAYYVGSAADEIYITPGGMVGSVGTVVAHEDISKFLENEGVKVTFIHAGEHKVEGNSYEPLSDEARAEFQRVVDEYYDNFTKAVARHRGTTVKDVIDNYGKGRVLLDREAVKRGMVDGVATLDQVIAKLQSPNGRRRKRASAAIIETRIEALK